MLETGTEGAAPVAEAHGVEGEGPEMRGSKMLTGMVGSGRWERKRERGAEMKDGRGNGQ